MGRLLDGLSDGAGVGRSGRPAPDPRKGTAVKRRSDHGTAEETVTDPSSSKVYEEAPDGGAP